MTQLSTALQDPANTPSGIKTGDSTNNVEMNKTQGVRLNGTSTVWRDMIMDIFGARLNTGAGKVDYDFDENAIVFNPSGSLAVAADRVGGNQEINHDMLVGSSITFKPHIHWWQQVTSNTVKPIVFSLRYRLQKGNEAKATSWTTITADAGAGGDDIWDHTSKADNLYNQITRFGTITVDCSISDTFQIQVARTDSETGDVSAYFIDMHGEVDALGSDDEITKT